MIKEGKIEQMINETLYITFSATNIPCLTCLKWKTKQQTKHNS